MWGDLDHFFEALAALGYQIEAHYPAEALGIPWTVGPPPERHMITRRGDLLDALLQHATTVFCSPGNQRRLGKLKGRGADLAKECLQLLPQCRAARRVMQDVADEDTFEIEPAFEQWLLDHLRANGGTLRALTRSSNHLSSPDALVRRHWEDDADLWRQLVRTPKTAVAALLATDCDHLFTWVREGPALGRLLFALGELWIKRPYMKITLGVFSPDFPGATTAASRYRWWNHQALRPRDEAAVTGVTFLEDPTWRIETTADQVRIQHGQVALIQWRTGQGDPTLHTSYWHGPPIYAETAQHAYCVEGPATQVRRLLDHLSMDWAHLGITWQAPTRAPPTRRTQSWARAWGTGPDTPWHIAATLADLRAAGAAFPGTLIGHSSTLEAPNALWLECPDLDVLASFSDLTTSIIAISGRGAVILTSELQDTWNTRLTAAAKDDRPAKLKWARDQGFAPWARPRVLPTSDDHHLNPVGAIPDAPLVTLDIWMDIANLLRPHAAAEALRDTLVQTTGTSWQLSDSGEAAPDMAILRPGPSGAWEGRITLCTSNSAQARLIVARLDGATTADLAGARRLLITVPRDDKAPTSAGDASKNKQGGGRGGRPAPRG
jgi:hypothetical protein